ncbi:MAG: hypothetical protein L0M04_14665 [Enterococcus sp.]|uniref:hypothetical protein n=1 Tax=Enterococcus gilvus TaxID=160453 RepID=UPI002655C1B6|nr:hypothetical protein [Enterococcus sp.]
MNKQFTSETSSDITYLPFGQKQLYLTYIIDLYNGKIITYTIGDKQDTAFIIDTLNQLLETTDVSCTVIKVLFPLLLTTRTKQKQKASL